MRPNTHAGAAAMHNQQANAEKITAFLNENPRECFCDHCIARATGVPEEQVDPTVRPLGQTAEFERKFGQICSRCGRKTDLHEMAGAGYGLTTPAGALAKVADCVFNALDSVFLCRI